MEEIIYMIKNGYRFSIVDENIKIKYLANCLKDDSIKNAWNSIKSNKKNAIEFITNHIKQVEFDLKTNCIDDINMMVSSDKNYIETIAIDINKLSKIVSIIILVSIDLEVRIDKESNFWNNPFMSEAVLKIKEKLKISC